MAPLVALVFPGAFGEYLHGSALYRRYKLALKRAGLRPLRFDDLRHTFGTQAISNPAVSILQLKAWMPPGHRHDYEVPALRAARGRGGANRGRVHAALARPGGRGGWRVMPRISFFYGIGIWMYWNEGVHQRPHFHARYGGHQASIAFDGEILVGSLPPRALRLVWDWAALRAADLEANWNRALAGDALRKIDPLP